MYLGTHSTSIHMLPTVLNTWNTVTKTKGLEFYHSGVELNPATLLLQTDIEQKAEHCS